MSRGNAPEFFRAKRPWSHRKDRLLREYVPAYLQKVARNPGRPIVVVDGFSGPGLFEDGSKGSPALIAEMIANASITHTLPAPVTAYFIEKDAELHANLVQNMRGYPFVATRHGEFLEHLAEVESLSQGKTLFLYLDPFTVEGLEWSALHRVFLLLGKRQSVEVLLNFNAASFARRGLAALAMSVPRATSDEEDQEDLDPLDRTALPTVEHLNDIVGGDWWRSVLTDATLSFAERVLAIRDGFCNKLRSTFREVCVHDVKAHWRHLVPRYSLVFGSRSSVALMLMNDAMVKSREMHADATAPYGGQLTLVENRPDSVVPEGAMLRQRILKGASAWISRADLVLGLARAHIGLWTESSMKREVGELLKAGSLRSESGKARANDETKLIRT